MKHQDQIDALNAWAAQAKKGDAYTYAPRARRLVTGKGDRSKIGDAAWRLHSRGLVELVQRRVTKHTEDDGGGLFDYIAIRTGAAI